ncbi:MAG: hypothetical protein ISR83_01855 [Candidatus Marinimicrobia bacterium]|nr:hypothetical protein [Candidatus Neomarinimicrobiota bacterium]
MNKTIYQQLHHWRNSLLFGLIIILLSLAGSTPHIINTQTLLEADNFGIHISPLRILLEPILGPILFYLRSYDPIPEFFVVYAWIAIAMLVLLLKGVFYKKISLIGALGRWAILSILLSGLWLMIFIYMISGPLPSNTIINHDNGRILFNTHTHSHWSHDGLISPKQQMDWHERNGYDAFFLTEHNHNENTLRFTHDQKKGLHPKIPHIMTGIEFSGTNHMLLLGLKSPLITFGLDDQLVIDSTHQDGGIVAVAHWFSDENNSIQHYIDKGVDGFEIDNRNNIYSNNARQQIIESCRDHNLFMLGSADYHGYGSAAHVWNGIQIPNWESLSHQEKTDSIMGRLKENRFNANSVFRYIDRPVFVKWPLWLSPIYSFVAYFKGLTLSQIFSWIIWLFLFQKFKRNSNYKFIMKNKIQSLSALCFVSSMGVLLLGLSYLQKAKPLVGFNEQYQEFGLNFSILGIIIGVVSLSIVWLNNKFSRL